MTVLIEVKPDNMKRDDALAQRLVLRFVMNGYGGRQSRERAIEAYKKAHLATSSLGKIPRACRMKLRTSVVTEGGREGPDSLHVPFPIYADDGGWRIPTIVFDGVIVCAAEWPTASEGGRP